MSPVWQTRAMTESGYLFFGVLPVAVMVSIPLGVAAAAYTSLHVVVRWVFAGATIAMGAAAIGAVAAWLVPGLNGWSRGPALDRYAEVFVDYLLWTFAFAALLSFAAVVALAVVALEHLTSPRRRSH